MTLFKQPLYFKVTTNMKKLLCLVALLLSFNISFSQEKEPDSAVTQQLEKVVISAQYTPRSEKNSIYKIKVLTKKIIAQKAANNLRELLQQELNLELSQNSVFGSSIELQGLSKENIKILIDGTPVIGRLNGIIDLSQISLQNIERIEIIEGPVSVFYGTDAMGGIINLISKKTQTKTIEGSISLYYESINAKNINGNIGYNFGENNIQINAGNYQFDGLSTNKSPRNLNWEQKNQYFTNFGYTRRIKKLKLHFNSRFSTEKLNNIGEPDRFGKIQDKDYYSRRIDNTLNIEGKAFRNNFIKASLSYLDYQRYHNSFNIDPITYQSTNAKNDNKSDNLVKFNYAGFKAQIGNNKKEHLSYAIGTDINITSTEGERILNKKQNSKILAIFTSINHSLSSKIEVQPALRYTYNNNYGSLLSPAFNSKIKINSNNTLRFSYALGFRAPSLKELFLDFHINVGHFTYIIVGNQELKVEKSHSFNLRHSFIKSLNNEVSFLIEPAIFYNDISNLIALSEITNFKRNYININQFKSVGSKIDFSILKNTTFSFKSGISLIGRYNKFTKDYSSKKFLYATEISSSINYQMKSIGTNLNIHYKYTGKRLGFFIDQNNGKLIKTTRKSFNNLDLNISKSIISNTLKTDLGIKNIFNVTDIETTNPTGEAHSKDMQLWGRSFFIKTTYTF